MTRTSKALRRLGVGLVAAATVASVAPALGATAAGAAGTPLLVANDCAQQSNSTTTTTFANTNGATGTAGTNPSNASGAGSGCTTQAQVNTVKTLTFTYSEGGTPVAGRTIDFRIFETNAQATTAGRTGNAQTGTGATGNGNASANFPNAQPSGTNSLPDPVTQNPGQLAACTTDANGQCSVNVTDSEAETVRVDATERQSGARAYEFVQFRANSTAVARLDEIARNTVSPDGLAPSPGRPVQLTYEARDSNGNCATNGPGVSSTCTGSIVRSQTIALKVDAAAFFTPNCTPTDLGGFNRRNGGAGSAAAVGTTPAQPSFGQLDGPVYGSCSFVTAPADDAQTGPLTSQGQTINVVTDQNGQFTVTVAEGRDTEFDNDGLVDVTLTATPTGGSAITPRNPGAGTTGTGSTANTACSTTNNTAGCTVQPITFSTKVKALNGASISIDPISGPAYTATNQTPDNPGTQSPVFVVHLKDQYGNLVASTNTGPNDKATLTKTGSGVLVSCGTGGFGPYTANAPCPANSNQGTQTTNNDGTTTQVYAVRGSFTDNSEQERFSVRPDQDVNGNPVDGTTTLTGKWIAPITEFNVAASATTGTGATGTRVSNTFDQSETDNVFTQVVAFQFYKQQAKTISFTTTPGSTVPVGTVVTVTGTVTDQFGRALQNYPVSFFRGGTSNNCSNTAQNNSGTNTNGFTDNLGRASFSFSCADASTQNITLVVYDQGQQQCNQFFCNQGAPGAEIGRATQTIVFTGSSVQPTSTATPTSTASPTNTATPGRGPLSLTVNTPLIPAGANGTLTGTGSANQQYELRCYTRPSTTYFTARSGSFDAAGNPVTFTLSLGRNTRCFLQYLNAPSSATGSVVINVRTVLSLSTVRTGVRTYIFQGRNLPRVAGQLITLYRVDNAGNEIRTTNLITDSSGIYRVTRTFTGSGTFQFKVRTPQVLNNAAGVSNTITVRVF